MKKVERPYYWKASNGDKTFYLLGTMHSHVSLKSLPENLLNHIKSADQIYLEIIEKDKNRIGLLKDIQSKSLDEVRKISWSKVLTPRAQSNLKFFLNSEKVKQYFAEKGWSTESPIAPAGALAALPVMAERGQIINTVSKSHYTWINKFARAIPEISIEWKRPSLDADINSFARKEILSVDSLDRDVNYMKGMLAKITVQKSIESINLYFGELPVDQAVKPLLELKKLIDSYYSGEELNLETKMSEDFYRDIIVNRNKQWMDILLNQTEEKSKNFVAVGAGHFFGTNGLLKLFRDNNYLVETVNF